MATDGIGFDPEILARRVEGHIGLASLVAVESAGGSVDFQGPRRRQRGDGHGARCGA